MLNLRRRLSETESNCHRIRNKCVWQFGRLTRTNFLATLSLQNARCLEIPPLTIVARNVDAGRIVSLSACIDTTTTPSARYANLQAIEKRRGGDFLLVAEM